MDDEKKGDDPTEGSSEGPAQPTQSFGEWLKAERTRRKVNLEEIAAVTKVHIMQLRSLEEDKVDKLPAPAFVRGFLVSYARHLGLDENEVLARYKNSHSSSLTPIADLLMPQTQRAARSASAPKVRIVSSPHITQAPGVKEVERPSPSVLNFRVVMIAAGFVGLLILVGALVALGKKQKPTETPVVENKTESVPAAPITSTPVLADASKTSAPSLPGKPVDNTVNLQTKPGSTSPETTLTGTKKYKFEIRALEQNWVSVRIDDESSKGMTLKPGAPLPFEADKKVAFSFSDAGNIEIRWNGVWYDPPGSRGDVKSLTLPEQLDTLTKKVAKLSLPPKPATPAATQEGAPEARTPTPADED